MSFKDWLKEWLPHIILIIIVIIVVSYIKKHQASQITSDGTLKRADGNGSLYYPGRGCDTDNIDVLLAKTYWAAYLDKRVAKWERVFIMVVIIIIIFMALVWRKIASVPKILTTGFVIFFVVYMVDNFLYVHGDMYNDANIRNNVKLLASKLGSDIDFVTTPKAPTCEVPDRVTIMGN